MLLIEKKLKKNGFVFIKNFYPKIKTSDLFKKGILSDFFTLASEVHSLIPQEKSTPNTYSGQYGLQEFPLHTDLAHWATPPRFLLLRCLVGDPSTKTKILDAYQLIKKYGLETTLFRALVQPRRPLDGSLPVLRIYQYSKLNSPIFRWDNSFIVPASTAGKKGTDILKEKILSAEPKTIKLMNKGDLLIIDNWRMLHGRSEASNKKKRIIERVYLEGKNGKN